jgi:hypothetical protein
LFSFLFFFLVGFLELGKGIGEDNKGVVAWIRAAWGSTPAACGGAGPRRCCSLAAAVAPTATASSDVSGLAMSRSGSDCVLQIFEAFSPLGAGVPMALLGRDDDAHVGKRPFFTTHEELMEEEYYDEQAPEKKRRLTPGQVQMLEQSFAEENKLEPERKTELARRLGMAPRQVAVWFQNRRARWKTKQLETNFDRLKAAYDALTADHQGLLADNDRLRAEVSTSICHRLSFHSLLINSYYVSLITVWLVN